MKAIFKSSAGQAEFFKKIKPWLTRLIGILLLVYLISRVQLLELLQLISSADKIWLISGIFLALCMMLVKIERWRWLLYAQGIRFPFRDAAAAYFSTYYVGIVTPGRAGEFLKIIYLRSKTTTSLGAALVSVLLDRLLDVIVLILLAAAGLTLIPEYNLFSAAWFWIAGFILACGGMLLLLRFGFVQKTLKRLLNSAARAAGIESTQAQADEFIKGFALVLKPRSLLPAIVLTLLSWFFLLYASYLIALSLEIPAAFWFLAFAMAVAGLLSLLPVSIAGIGVRDTALVAILGLVGISVQASLAYSLLYFAVFGVFLGLVGAFYWYRYPIQGR
jgi:glycosyltransferase 2 family protein